MSLNALMRWLKPREMVFFELLEGSAANILEAAQLFDRELRSGDATRFAELRRQMKDLEHKGDEITHEIIDRLNQTFVTPIEREDILELAHCMDDVADCIDAVCERLVLYRIDRIMPAAMELASVIVEGAQDLVKLVGSLRRMDNVAEIRTRIRHVHVLENKADSLYHAALAQIFESPKDPIELMKWKEILETIEDATDRIERVAQCVGSTVMRNA
jgi:predicted phosphate transport protein (TIGR00153 family)